MKTVLDFLGLNENASEAAVLAAVTKIKSDLAAEKEAHKATEAKLTASEGIVDKQKAKIDKFDEEQAKLNEKLVKDTVETAIKEGKVEEKQKDELIDKFKNDVDGLQLILGAIKTGAVTITNKLNNSTEPHKDIPEDRKDWDLRKWQKEDQAGWEKLIAKNPELHAEMHLEFYGVELEKVA